MKVTAFDSNGPGRFSCRADERVYRMSLDGSGETVGDVSEMGVAATRMDGHLFGLALAGAIVLEDDQGFVSVEYFDDQIDLDGR